MMKVRNLVPTVDCDRKENTNGHAEPAVPRGLNPEIKRVNVDFPIWMVQALDREALRVGVSRQAIIKTWLANYLSTRSGHTD